MLIAIAVILVVVLLALALLPPKRREPELRQAPPQSFLNLEPTQPVRSTTLRQQQLDEEAVELASEYQRRADAVWHEELRTKASKLLGSSKSKAD